MVIKLVWDLILLDLKANNLAYHCFILSERSDHINHSRASSMNSSMFVSVPPVQQVPQRPHRGPRWISLCRGALSLGKSLLYSEQ